MKDRLINKIKAAEETLMQWVVIFSLSQLSISAAMQQEGTCRLQSVEGFKYILQVKFVQDTMVNRKQFVQMLIHHLKVGKLFFVSHLKLSYICKVKNCRYM